MSLINEALKKAQKQRTGDTPSLTAMPAIGGESAARIARRGKPEGFNALLLKIGLGVGALAVVIVGAVLILRRPAAAPAPTPATTFTPLPSAPAIVPATSQPVEAPVVVAPVAAPVTTPATTLVVTPNSPPARANPAVPAPAATTVVLAPAEAPKPVETAAIQLAPAPAQPVVPAALRKLEPRAINFVNSIRVAGIRASANDSKVLMNDRVYRVGDTVEAEMGLKLAGITANSLTFEDENGGRFTRNF
jgi:hypothetical protein